MSKGAFKDLFKKAKENDDYWVEKTILEFTSELSVLMTSQGITKKEFAETLGTSPAYVTKIFRGNANFTLATMVKLTRALGGQLHTRVIDQKKPITWYGCINGGGNNTEQKWVTKVNNSEVSHYGKIIVNN